MDGAWPHFLMPFSRSDTFLLLHFTDSLALDSYNKSICYLK